MSAETVKAKTIPFYKHFGAKGFIVPLAVVALLGFVWVLRSTHHPPVKETAQEGGLAGASALYKELQQQGVIGAPTSTTAPPPAPNYDYLTCTHWRQGDPKCVPLMPDPLTTEAKQLIGWQGGIRVNGVLSSDTTRDVADQIRKLAGVNHCDMYLGLAQKDNGVLDRTVFASQKDATPGAVKLYDCTPMAGAAPVTVPARGAS